MPVKDRPIIVCCQIYDENIQYTLGYLFGLAVANAIAEREVLSLNLVLSDFSI